MDTMGFTAGNSAVPPTYTETVSMTGTGFDLKGFYDYPLDLWISTPAFLAATRLSMAFTARKVRRSIENGNHLLQPLAVSYLDLGSHHSMEYLSQRSDPRRADPRIQF